MSDWHFGMDYDMWLYPPVDWTAPDYDYELPEPIEAANIEGTLLVNAEDAIEQVHCLQTENAKLRELVARLIRHIEDPPCESCMSEMSCAGGEGLTNCDEYQFMVCDAHELGVDA